MKYMYNVLLIVFYILRAIWLYAICFSRLVFYHTWTPKEETFTWFSIVMALAVYYSVLFWGIKRRFGNRQVINILLKLEKIFSYIIWALLILLCILLAFRIAFLQILPIILVPGAILLIRLLIIKQLPEV